MKCILICAGYATRLFPLTENFPKALLEVGGRPILDYILDQVNLINEVDGIYLVTNAKYTPHFEEWATKKNNIKPIKVLNDGTTSNSDRLGAIGDIQYTIENENIDEDIMVIAGDNLFTFDLKGAFEFYNEKKAPTVCVKKESNIELLKRVGVANLDENMKIIDFEEKPADPKGDYVVYAEYFYPREILKEFKIYLDEGYSNDAPGNFVKYIYKKVPTYGYAFEGECYDVGTHDALAEVNEIYSKNK